MSRDRKPSGSNATVKAPTPEGAAIDARRERARKARLELAERRKKAARTGRPSKLSPESLEDFCAALRDCASIEAAAAWAGLSKKTVYNWFRRARKKGEPREYRDFLHAAQQAAAEAERIHAGVVARAGRRGDWKASLEILQRRKFPRWGDRKRIEHEGNEKRPVVFEWAGPKPPGAAGGSSGAAA